MNSGNGDSRNVILYDEDCGFCRWSLSKFLAWDRRRRLRPVPLQSDEADRLLAGMDAETRMRSWHLVTPAGRVYSAGAAVPPLMRLLPGGRPLALASESLPVATERLYRWVADHRDRLGRTLGAQACSVDPRRPGSARPR
jgi:predicted DCC family thiol-disulfide oxidoreductase YuxK